MNKKILRFFIIGFIAALFSFAFVSCGEETDICEANGRHTYSTPSCESPTKCVVCGAAGTEALGHDFTSQLTSPTCSSEGYTSYTCSRCDYSYIADRTQKLPHNYIGKFCDYCATERPSVNLQIPDGLSYLRINEDGEASPDGDYIAFGTYPQSKVEDNSIISGLNSKAGELPSIDDCGDWTSYGYYINGNVSDFMWYIDINHEGRDYRGVYFVSYRPSATYTDASGGAIHQPGNGYTVDSVYWFEYEPLKWRILREEDGKALLLCDIIIDSQAYQSSAIHTGNDYYVKDNDGNIFKDENDNPIYASDYSYSTVRAWLNREFYNTAFDEIQKQLIAPSDAKNAFSKNVYGPENVVDNIFLLSYSDVINSELGFNPDPMAKSEDRLKWASDYAECQGVDQSLKTGYAYWWTCSPSVESNYNAYLVDFYGESYAYNVTNTSMGVCPSLWISL